MKLYEILEDLSFWIRCRATYLEMKHHLKQVLKGKENNYVKFVYPHDRGIGKTCALARLSAKYNIPIVVSTHNCKREIERGIPSCLPKYFKKKKPTAIVIDDIKTRGKRFDILLVEESLDNKQQETLLDISRSRYVGYVNFDWSFLN